MYNNRKTEKHNIPNIRFDVLWQRAEDITVVVLRLDARLERRLPIADDVVHDRPAGDVDVLQRLEEAALVDVEELLLRRLAGRGPIKVGRGPHGNDAGKVDTIVDGIADQRFHDRVIFLGGGAVRAGAVGEELDVVAERVADQFAVEESIRGGDVALDDRGRLVGRGVGVFFAVFDGDGAVVQFLGGSLLEGAVAQRDVELEDFSSVLKYGVLIRRFGAERDRSGREILRLLSRIDLVCQSNLDSVAS